jgi:hypothetical protein
MSINAIFSAEVEKPNQESDLKIESTEIEALGLISFVWFNWLTQKLSQRG